MTLTGALSLQTFLSVVVLAIVVRGRPEGWMGFSPSRLSSGISFRSSPKFHLTSELGESLLLPVKPKRDSEHHIEECLHMTSEEGEYYYKAKSHPDGNACGIFIYGETDQNIEIRFSYIDFPCENGGLIAVVDGWELNGEVFPSPDDHPKALKSRFIEICGKRKIKQTFASSQNVALIQYRVPSRGASFSFSVRFVKNPNPCNVFIQMDETYTLRNYNRRSNCSISSLFPAAVKILNINVGVTPARDRGLEFETGVFYKVRSECQKRGLDDYLQIGGSLGLDNGNMQIADTICGLSSKPDRHVNYVRCGTSTARLVSSGAFDNSVTVSFTRLTENDMSIHMNAVCDPDDLLLEQDKYVTFLLNLKYLNTEQAVFNYYAGKNVCPKGNSFTI